MTLEEAYRRSILLHTLDQRLRSALPEAGLAAGDAKVPRDLYDQIARKLAQTPQAAWDDVLSEIAMPEET